MTRDDVANLVIRTFALWLGASGLGTLGSMPWMIEGPGGRGMIAGYALVLLAAAAILWLAAGPLTRAMFARPDREVPFALTAAGIPPLACFVVGVLQIAAAIPEGAGWLAVRLMRSQEGGLMSPGLDAGRLLDEQGAAAGAALVARFVIGAVLIVFSRRRDLWAPGDAESAE